MDPGDTVVDGFMKKHSFLTVLLLLISVFGFSQHPKSSSIERGNQTSLWKGFERLDFNYNGNDIRLIFPSKKLPGNPWIWRARFPDWHTDADSILVAKGYHLAYINTDNQYGSPGAIAIWDKFYELLTTEYKLNKKVALMGVSRGGLFVYNWAKKNPEKVASIYAEAPVCDFNSWPGGFGKGKGSPEDWAKLKEAYGFNSDNQARSYKDNPINGLENLAAHKVPILHMIGLKDKIVPPEENTIPLINKYISHGGVATIVPCTSGEQELEGHHFPIETPQIVADFISYHSPKTTSLSSSEFHDPRDGLLNSKIRFEQNKKGRVVFLGGSITYNPGWRDSVSTYLKTRFPKTHFEFINAGIPSMGSTPAAFRIQRDVLTGGKVDLLFEEAAVNDATNGRTQEEQINAMEGIIRHLRTSNPGMDIVMMHFADPGKIASYNQGKEPEVILNHNKVARHYAIPTINLAKEVAARINNGEFSWETDFVDLHPSPFGQGVYAHSIIDFLKSAYASQVSEKENTLMTVLPKKLAINAYDKGGLRDISEAQLSKGWSIDPSWKPKNKIGTRPNYTQVPMLVGKFPGKAFKYKFTGNTIGIAVAAGPDAGIIEYRIDKSSWTKLNLFTKWSSQLHLPWYYTLATGLSEGNHVLELRLTGEKDKKSTGYSCRIRYFYTNQHQ